MWQWSNGNGWPDFVIDVVFGTKPNKGLFLSQSIVKKIIKQHLI